MTNADPKQVVRQYLDCLKNGDTEGALAMHTDDVVLDFPGSSDLPWAGVWNGAAEAKRWYQVLFDTLEIRSHVHNAFIAEGDMVLVLGDEVSASRKSGKEFRVKWAWAFKVRGDRIASWTGYEDTEAIAACGPYI